jgi:hypothetical protein
MAAGQGASLAEQRHALRTQIRTWEQIRAVYMPGLLQYRLDAAALSSNDASAHPEDDELWLPSKIPADRRGAVCVSNLPALEDKLHTVQCQDSLEGL